MEKRRGERVVFGDTDGETPGMGGEREIHGAEQRRGKLKTFPFQLAPARLRRIFRFFFMRRNEIAGGIKDAEARPSMRAADDAGGDQTGSVISSN